MGRTGYPVRSRADLQALAPILRAESGLANGLPQIYVVTLDGTFVLDEGFSEVYPLEDTWSELLEILRE